MIRRRQIALGTLGLYLAGAFLLPFVHQYRHADDHEHVGEGGLRFAPILPGPGAAQRTHVETAHRSFDADLAALDLSDAGHFGVAAVDCEYAAFTLAACADPAAPAHSFGDELLARATHRHPDGPPAPAHGRGSLLHFGLALLAPSPVVLPPPLAPPIRLALVPCPPAAGFAPPTSLRARAPPPSPIA